MSDRGKNGKIDGCACYWADAPHVVPPMWLPWHRRGLLRVVCKACRAQTKTTVHFVDLSSTRYDSMLGRIRAQAMRNVVLRLTGQFIQQCDLRYCNAMVAAGL